MTRKPRLYRVLVGGYHIDQMIWHQGPHVSTHEIIQHWICQGWRQQEVREACGDCGGTDAAKSTLPEWRRSPFLEPLLVCAQAVHFAFLIERAHDPCAQCRRSTFVRQF